MQKECFYTSGGIWISVVPFSLYDQELVMAVDTEDINVYAVYYMKSYDELFYPENMHLTGNLHDVPKEIKAYYKEAVIQLLDTVLE